MAGGRQSKKVDIRFVIGVIGIIGLFVIGSIYYNRDPSQVTSGTISHVRFKTADQITRYIDHLHGQDLRQVPGQLQEVLIYQSYNSWSGIEKEYLPTPNYLGHDVNNVCPVKCTFTMDATRWREADALVFESDTPHFVQWRQKPLKYTQKLPHQKFILVSYETKIYYPTQLYLAQMTDITVSYEKNSEVPVSFMCSWGGGSLADLLKPPPPKPSNLSPVVWMGTNCGAGGAEVRQRYIEEMMKHINIDSYGGCLHNKDMPKEWQFPIYDDHGSSMRNKVAMFSKYKFVLAFENNNVTDYVTEKIMNVFQAGSIPVYMGAPNIEEWVPEGSVIRTDNFKGPAELARYLKKVESNPQLYKSYFKWKEDGMPAHFVKKYSQCIFYQGRCRICQKVASQHPLKTDFSTKQLSTWIPPPSAPVGKSAHAMMFNGKGYVDLGKSSHWDLQHQFTLSAWILPREFSDLRIIDKNPAGESYGIDFDVIEVYHRGYLRLCTVECFIGIKPLLLDSWQHVSVVFDSEEQRGVFYVNGEYDTDFFVWSGPAPLNQLPLRIGADPDGNHGWKGRIDEVTIWNKALPQWEVKNLLFHRLIGNETGLLGYYLFDEGTGNTVHDASRWARHGKLIDGNWVQQFEKPFYIYDHLLPQHRNAT